MTDNKANNSLVTTIEELLSSFSKLYFFNKLHRLRYYDVVNPSGKRINFQVGDQICFGAEEFSVLWLIESIIESLDKKDKKDEKDEKLPSKPNYCERSFLEQCFLWRKSPKDDKTLNTFNNRFDSIIRKLQSTDMIDYIDKKENRKKHLLFITPEGEKLLQKLKEERVNQLTGILELSEIKPDEYKRLVKEFSIMADRAWEILSEQAKNTKLKPDDKILINQ